MALPWPTPVVSLFWFLTSISTDTRFPLASLVVPETLPVKVMVDQFNNLDGSKPDDKAIQESDETNNEASTTFKVVLIKTANPSFYLGFTALTASVGAAVLLSRYYRDEDEE